ncbi:unnamed protein product [Umbelopsis sp. WA50703]
MKIIHQNGYSEEELYPWRITVYKNLIESAQSLIFGMMKFGLDFELLKNKEYASLVKEYSVPTELTASLNPEIAAAIQSIWEDPVVPKLLDRGGSDFYLMDSAP